MRAWPVGDSIREIPPLKLKDDLGNRHGNKWHFDGNLSALSGYRPTPPPPAPRVKTADIERMAVVEDEGMDNANAESRR